MSYEPYNPYGHADGYEMQQLNANLTGQEQGGYSGQRLLWSSSLLGAYGAYTRQSISRGPDSDGWYEYIGNPSPEGKLCQFWIDDGEDRKPWVGYNTFDPLYNVAYLKWRPTGIYKETDH